MAVGQLRYPRTGFGGLDMSRIHEIGDVSPDNQTRWLAGQVDEVETALRAEYRAVSEALAGQIGELTKELKATRGVLTGILISTITLLMGVLVGLIVTVTT